MFQLSVAHVGRTRKRRALLAFLGVTLLVANASAVDILVTTDADSGAGSLREAFTQAASGDRIVFDIPGTPTIQLLSDLPTVVGDISFANNNVPVVTIDRNSNAALDFDGSLVDPTVLVINTSGAPSPDADINASTTTTIFGNGDVTGNLQVPGTLAPGANADPGTIGTLNVTGDLDLSSAQVQLDISATGGSTSSDLVNVTGTATVAGATLDPNFIGNEFAIGQQFLVLDTTNALGGAFANQGDVFAVPNQPFLQAVNDFTRAPNDFGFLIEDNGNSFTTIVSGCNQTSASVLLDQLQASGTPPTAVVALRNGSTEQVLLAVNQLSGSIYPSLIGAEINHIQNNLESVRDRIALQLNSPSSQRAIHPWVRAYGVNGQVDHDDCQTMGYHHQIGGIELGCGLGSTNGLTAHTFAHLATANLDSRGVDQDADIDSYRMGGSVEYIGQNAYVLAVGGAGVQEYDVRRSLTALQGSSFAESSFDGSAQFGYFELGTMMSANPASVLTPYLALHATRVDLDSITETGDAEFALINNGGDGDSLRGVLGLAIVQSSPTPIGTARTGLRFGWMHEYLDESELFVSQVAGGGTPTGSLADRGVAAGKDWGFVRMQVDMGTLLGGQFMVAYEGQFNSNSSFNSFLAGTGWIY